VDSITLVSCFVNLEHYFIFEAEAVVCFESIPRVIKFLRPVAQVNVFALVAAAIHSHLFYVRICKLLLSSCNSSLLLLAQDGVCKIIDHDMVGCLKNSITNLLVFREGLFLILNLIAYCQFIFYH
jgi:hypothetical protein